MPNIPTPIEKFIDRFIERSKNKPGGLAELNVDGIISKDQLGDFTITDSHYIDYSDDRFDLEDVGENDMVIAVEDQETFIFKGGDQTLEDNWSQLKPLPAPLDSFNGRTGHIEPDPSDYTPDFIGAAEEVHDHTGQTISPEEGEFKDMLTIPRYESENDVPDDAPSGSIVMIDGELHKIE